MNWLLILVLLAISVRLLLVGMAKPGRIYEYPFLAGATFLGFVLPQLPALAADPFLPPGAFAKAISFTILCAAVIGLGWSSGNRPIAGFNWAFDERRLLWLAAILSVIGAFFFFKLSRLPDDMRLASQMSGLPVAYLFFAKMLSYGFAVAMICCTRRPSRFAIAVILFDLIFYADRIFIAGRRSETAEFLLIIGLALWFHRRRAAPRVLALVAMLAAAVSLTSTGDYRKATHDQDGPNWSAVSEIDVVKNFKDVLENGGPEMRNAILLIHATDRAQTFDYGITHWNMLVFNFVPAQLVGADFKASLGIPLPSADDPDYQPPTGSTETGMADAFASFWYFGAIKFFLAAYLLARVYRSAMAGHTIFQLAYMLTLVPSMLAITHYTQLALSAWVHMGMLLVPMLLLARVRPAPAAAPPIRALAPACLSAGPTAER